MLRKRYAITHLLASNCSCLAQRLAIPFYCRLYAAFALLLSFAMPIQAGVGFWTQGSGLPGTGMSDIAIDTVGNLYVSSALYSVYKSSDNADHWLAAADGLPGHLSNKYFLNRPERLSLDRSGNITASTFNGDYQNSDGKRWTAIPPRPLSDYTFLPLLSTPGDSRYGGDGIYIAGNGGGSWTVYGNALGNTHITSLAFSADRGIIYAAIDTTGGSASERGIYKSTDHGATWLAINSGIPAGSYINALAAGSDGVFYAGTYRMDGPGGLFKSVNGGDWTSIVNNDLPIGDVWGLVIDRSGVIYATTDNGVIKSNEGGAQWRSVSNGLPGAFNYLTLAGAPDGSIYAGSAIGFDTYHFGVNGIAEGGEGGGVFKSIDGGKHWTAANGGLTTAIRALVVGPQGTVYAGTDHQGVYKSGDGGLSWIPANAGIVSLPQPGFFGGPQKPVNALAVDTTGRLYVAISYDGVFSSSDGGANWTALNKGLENSMGAGINASGFYITSLATALDGSVYCAGVGGVYKLGSDGWSALGGSLLRPTYIGALAVSGNGNVYAAASKDKNDASSIFKSSDGGGSWAAINQGLPNAILYALATSSDGNVYVGTDNGVYVNRDGGNWNALNREGLPGAAISLAWVGGSLFASSGRGLFQYTPSSARLVDASGRAQTLGGFQVAIAGFVIRGGSKTVLVSGRGPSLAAAGVSGSLADPHLNLFDGTGNLLASNDNWQSNANAAAIQASGGAPGDLRESAILVTLPAGTYTAVMDGVGGATGNSLIGVDTVSNEGDTGTLTNLSTRAQVGTGDNVLIGGFIIVDGPKTVLLTARGPSLAAAGVSGILADPVLELHDAGGTLIDSNDDWQSASNAIAIAASGGMPTTDKEAAILRRLEPGAYTVIVRGSGNTQGVALVAIDTLAD